MRSFIRHLAICLILFCGLNMAPLPVCAQLPDVSFRLLDYSHGLPDYFFTYELLQDHLGRLWIATDKGLYVYDGYEITTFRPDLGDSTALTEANTHSLMMDQDNRMWIGTRNMGICIYDPRTNAFTRILPESQGGPLPTARIWGFQQDHQGFIWISARPGLMRCDPRTMSFDYYPIEIDAWQTTFNQHDFDYVNTLRLLRPDPVNPDILWLGTRAGLVSFNTADEVFRFHEMPFSSRRMGLDSRNFLLTDLVFTDDENMWIASWAGGVLHYNTRTEEWFQYYEPIDDLTECVINFIQKKDADELWITSRTGAGIFNQNTRTFTYFPTTRVRKDGVRASHRYDHMLITRDSVLVVASPLGINMASDYSGALPLDTSVAPILTRIYVNNVPAPISSTVHATEIVLTKDQKELSFTLAWPVFGDKDHVGFRFMLEGYNADWVHTGQSRTVQYTNLKPGQYTLHYASSADGEHWVSGLTRPSIRIQRPFWSHPLTLGGAGMVVICVIGGVYHMRVRHIRREEKMKREFSRRLAENEMKALRAQMNPHFMFNSLNSIKNYILQENTEAASKYLTKFSQLMRAILHNSEHTLITLHEELQALRLYIEIEARRFRGSFNYQINVAGDVESEKLHVPPLLIQPFVENAIWHGLMMKEGDRHLVIDVRKNGRDMKIEVADNGIGRTAAQELTRRKKYKRESFGMKITNDRIALIRNTMGIDATTTVEDLYDAQGKPAGTRVTISVPLIREETIKS